MLRRTVCARHTVCLTALPFLACAPDLLTGWATKTPSCVCMTQARPHRTKLATDTSRSMCIAPLNTSCKVVEVDTLDETKRGEVGLEGTVGAVERDACDKGRRGMLEADDRHAVFIELVGRA